MTDPLPQDLRDAFARGSEALESMLGHSREILRTLDGMLDRSERAEGTLGELRRLFDRMEELLNDPNVVAELEAAAAADHHREANPDEQPGAEEA